MALTEQKIVDEITVVEDGIVRVRTATVIKRDDVEINRSFHRHMLAPGDDLTGQDERVTAVANATWTSKVISDYKASQPKLEE